MSAEIENYSAFFEVKQDYFPEITPNSIRQFPNGWMDTFPHSAFVNLLEKVERMIARKTSGHKHSIWVRGSYGTGKSRLLWTVRELLTCPDEQFQVYFDKYDALRENPDLRNKLLTWKHGKIVTAFRYASGEITSDRRFIMAIYDSVSDALKKAGYNYLGERTLRGQIAAWLEKERNQRIFQLAVLDNPKYNGWGSFAGKSPNDILLKLRDKNVTTDTLVNDILEASEDERIGVYDLSIDDLKTWLTDVIDANELTALVFFWDEFSSFFKMHRDSIDVFQSLLELCADKPFEMIISTHGVQAIGIDAQANTVKDRFEPVEITMPDNVAFDLIAHAIEPNPAAITWPTYKDNLAGITPDARQAVVKSVGVTDKVLRDMIPIHPMTALALKYLSENFASNQRSMFNFMKNEDSENLQAFQWFIQNYSPEESELLTMDYLWNFFYEKGRDEHVSGEGRTNLDMIIASVLDTYPQNARKLNREQSRVLKVVLMMQAISRKLNNSVALLRPTEKNILLAFEGWEDCGTGVNYFTASPKNILKYQLKDQLRILVTSPTENGVDEYITATVQGDQVQIDAIVKRLTEETATSRLVTDAKLMDAFPLSVSQKSRFSFVAVTVANFTREVNKLTDRSALRVSKGSAAVIDFHIYGVICFARDENEQKKIRKLIAEARTDPEKRELVLIDASGIPMGADRFEEWAKYAGNEEYWRNKDPQIANTNENRAREQTDAWNDAVKNGKVLVYYAEKFDKELCAVKQLKSRVLPDIVRKKYPLSFDHVSETISENLFHEDNYPTSAKYGIRQLYVDKRGERPFGGIFRPEDIQLLMNGAWNAPQYWERSPMTPISKLKIELDAMIQSHFNTDIRVSHEEIYDFLAERGFMPCNLYAFLTGFLLKEYAGEPYRYGIGETGEAGDIQTPDYLGDHIGECFKRKNPSQGIEDNRYKKKYLEIMSISQKAFVDFASKAFQVPASSSVEKAASQMRVRLKKLGCPLWCYKTIDTDNLDSFLDIIGRIANDNSGGNVPSLATKLGDKLLDIPAASDQLANLLTPENGQKALEEFLRMFRDGKLAALADEIRAPRMMNDVRDTFSGEALWLWNQETGEEQLDKLITDYEIVAASNRFAEQDTFSAANSYGDCMRAWRETARYTHIPLVTLKEQEPGLRQWLAYLDIIRTENSLKDYQQRKSFLKSLREQEKDIRAFLSGRVKLFASTFASYLSGLDDEAVKRIYTRLPNSSFGDDKTTFAGNVEKYAGDERTARKKNQLREKWKKASGFDDPIKWSDYYKTPILALLPDTRQQEKARKLFDALRASNPNEAEINAAMEYLDSTPPFLALLNNQAEIDRAFVRELIGKYHLLVSVTQARDAIESRSSMSSCYDWLSGNAAKLIIQQEAEKNYLSGKNQELLNWIDNTMDGSRAKEYLKRLVKDKLDVGIQIMDEEGVPHESDS